MTGSSETSNSTNSSIGSSLQKIILAETLKHKHKKELKDLNNSHAKALENLKKWIDNEKARLEAEYEEKKKELYGNQDDRK